MRNKKKEIECLNRLHSLNGSYEDIVQFLLQEEVVTASIVTALRQSSDQAKDMWSTLFNLRASGKFQLLEYEWHVLPVERINITVVTDKSKKEFTYNF